MTDPLAVLRAHNAAHAHEAITAVESPAKSWVSDEVRKYAVPHLKHHGPRIRLRVIDHGVPSGDWSCPCVPAADSNRACLPPRPHALLPAAARTFQRCYR